MAIKFGPDLIPLHEIPRNVPKIRGRKVAMSTVYRWVSHGLSGIRLETIAGPSGTYTTKDALAEFFESVNRARKGEPQSHPAPAKSNSKAHSLAMKQLESAGI